MDLGNHTTTDHDTPHPQQQQSYLHHHHQYQPQQQQQQEVIEVQILPQVSQHGDCFHGVVDNVKGGEGAESKRRVTYR